MMRGKQNPIGNKKKDGEGGREEEGARKEEGWVERNVITQTRSLG